MINELDKSIRWDRMSRGYKWPKMILTFDNDVIIETNGLTYQCEHGLRLNGKRPKTVTILEDIEDELKDFIDCCTRGLKHIHKEEQK